MIKDGRCGGKKGRGRENSGSEELGSGRLCLYPPFAVEQCSSKMFNNQQTLRIMQPLLHSSMALPACGRSRSLWTWPPGPNRRVPAWWPMNFSMFVAGRRHALTLEMASRKATVGPLCRNFRAARDAHGSQFSSGHGSGVGEPVGCM